MTAGGWARRQYLTRHFSLRVIQAEYMWSRFWNPSSSTGDRAFQNDMRLSAGILFRFGGEHRAPPPPPVPPPPPSHRWPRVRLDKGMVYVGSGDVITVRAQGSSPDNNPLTWHAWAATGGSVTGTGAEVQWNSSGVAPGNLFGKSARGRRQGRHTVECSADVRVDPRPNHPPTR